VPAEPPELPVPSDRDERVSAAGGGDVSFAVVSMSERAADGDDAGYLRWHMLDHLPEQYRIDGLRWGQRWRSTDACRAARVAEAEPFDRVDHVVTYLFGGAGEGPVDAALDTFFELGGALRAAGRMPVALPRVLVSGWEVVEKRASDRTLVGAAVVPWRPARGVYVIVDELGPDLPPLDDTPPDILPAYGATDDRLDRLVAVDGVAGAWTYRDGHARHRRLESCSGCRLTICHLDGDPVATGLALGELLLEHHRADRTLPLFAAPFEVVQPWSWER